MPGTLGLTIASGVDMPRLALAALLGQPVPAALGLPRAAPWCASWTSASLDPAEVSSDLERDLADQAP